MFLIAALAAACPAMASAQNVVTLDLQQALSSDEFKAALGDDIRFYFASGVPSSIKTPIGEIVLHRTTVRSFGSPEKTCRRVLLTLLQDFQKRAQGVGANAVINVQSAGVQDAAAGVPTMIECPTGQAVRARIAIRGTLVQTEN